MNKMLAVVIIVLLCAGGFLLWSQRSQARSPLYEEKALNLPVEGIVTNLADGHYVRVSLVLEYVNPDATTFLNEAVYKIKAVVIQATRQEKAIDLQNVELYKKKLQVLINETVQPWKITGIYITEFIMQ